MDIFEYKTIIFEIGQPISIFSSSIKNEFNNLGMMVGTGFFDF